MIMDISHDLVQENYNRDEEYLLIFNHITVISRKLQYSYALIIYAANQIYKL